MRFAQVLSQLLCLMSFPRSPSSSSYDCSSSFSYFSSSPLIEIITISIPSSFFFFLIPSSSSSSSSSSFSSYYDCSNYYSSSFFCDAAAPLSPLGKQSRAWVPVLFAFVARKFRVFLCLWCCLHAVFAHLLSYLLCCLFSLSSRYHPKGSPTGLTETCSISVSNLHYLKREVGNHTFMIL